MTNDYIYAIYELQSLFSRLLTNTMPASSNISKMFKAKEVYYVRKIIEELAHLKVVNHDSTLKHEIMQNCVNHAIELTAVYAQYLDVDGNDGLSEWGTLNTPTPDQEPNIPYIQSIIDNFVENDKDEQDGNAIDFHHPDIRNIRIPEPSNDKSEPSNDKEDNKGEDEYKHDSAQLFLPDAATVEHDIDGVIFVRSVINDDVIYILPRHLFKTKCTWGMAPNEAPHLMIGELCLYYKHPEVTMDEAKKYILRLEKTLAINALDPRTVDLKSNGEILILTLQGYDWRKWIEKTDGNGLMRLRPGFEIHVNNKEQFKYIAHTWESDTTPFNHFELHDSAYVLVPTYTPQYCTYKVTDYDLVRCLPKPCNLDIEEAENIAHLQSIFDEYARDFNISDAIKIAEMSNPLETPRGCLMVGGVQRGSRLLNFDMEAIDSGLGSTFKNFRDFMKFPAFDHLDQKKDGYINMDIGHWGLNKYFFTTSSKSKMFEGCRLSCTTFESLMLSIYNISPVGRFEDFIYDFINDESKVDDDLGYKSWWFYKTKWADFQHLKDEDTRSLYVAHLLHSLGSFEFYYREYGEVYLYELKSETFEKPDTYALKLKLIRQVEDDE